MIDPRRIGAAWLCAMAGFCIADPAQAQKTRVAAPADTFPNVWYLRGHPASAEQRSGRLVLSDRDVVFTSKREGLLFKLPYDSVAEVSGVVRTGEASELSKFAVGIFAKKQHDEYVYITTADGHVIILKTKKNASPEIIARARVLLRGHAQSQAGVNPAGSPAPAEPASVTEPGRDTTIRLPSTDADSHSVRGTTRNHPDAPAPRTESASPTPRSSGGSESFRGDAQIAHSLGDLTRLNVISSYEERKPGVLVLYLSEGYSSTSSAEYHLQRLHSAYLTHLHHSEPPVLELWQGEKKIGEYTGRGLP